MILYIHPESHMMLKEIYPLSLPALINRIQHPVRGVFEHEFRQEDLRSVRVVLMDIHWYGSMARAMRLSRRIRRINPAVAIVCGGISATLFARQILRDSEIDYVIRGDGEIPLQGLVDALMNGGNVREVPNVAGKGFLSKGRYSLTRQDMDEGNYRDVSFFPSLEQRAWNLHRCARGKPFPTYPFLVSYRGCPFHCRECCGAPDWQRRLFGRDRIVRSPERLREDLECWDSEERLSYVNIYHDFVTVLPEEYARTVLDRTYRLFVYYDFFRTPGEKELDLLMGSFAGGILVFGLDRYHANSSDLAELGPLIDRIRRAQGSGRFNVRLTFNRRFVKERPDYAFALKRVVDETRVWAYNGDFWWEDNPTPDHEGWGTEEGYRRCLRQGGRRYFWWNMVYRAGTALYSRFPALANLGAKVWFRL